MSANDMSRLASVIPEGAWQSTTRADSEQIVRWLPLFGARSETYPLIGVSACGTWVAATANGLTNVYEQSSAWLLALEYSLDEFRATVQGALARYGVGGGHLLDLPYLQIIKQGLQYGNDIGVSRAIDWLESDLSLKTPDIRDMLESICLDGRYSQHVRHRAAKLAAPIRRVVQ